MVGLTRPGAGSSSRPGDMTVTSDIWEGVGVERRIEGGEFRACCDASVIRIRQEQLLAHKGFEALRCMYGRGRLLIFIRPRL